MTLETPAWLNAEFMQKVLRKSEKDESIRVVDLSCKAATNSGDNYLSEMHRSTVTFTRDINGRRITEETSLIVKAQLETELQNMIRNAVVFETEISMMSDTLVEMNRFLSPVKPLSPRCLYTRIEKPKLLVMEDLASLGFRMGDRLAGLDLDHCLLAVRRLAKFHGSSVAFKEKDSEAMMKYTKGMYHKESEVMFGNFIKRSTKAIREQVAKWPELGPRVSKKIINFSKVVYERAQETVMYKEEEFNVLNHGDCWLNNMLFKYDHQGKPIDLMFVDFQMSVYGSPVIDLLYFLTLSASVEVRVNNQELLVKEYHNSLTSTMLKLRCATRAPSFEELKKTVNDRAILLVTYSFINLPMVLLAEEGNCKNPYEGKLYRDVMLRMIPIYDKLGLLDI